jgi:glutamyl-tRNA synthetase
MHIGGVRTALFSYLWARKNNGTFILRIEDTDKEREVAGSMQHIIESLHWLGIEWDFGPENPGPFGSCIQSERLDTYLKVAHDLAARGLAYPDPYTPEQVEVFRAKAEAERRPLLMREHRPATFGPWDGKAPLRFKVPEIKRFKWHDEVRGDLEAGEESVDDFILIKSDGYPTYNFAHIIDDEAMGMTHIFRSDEFISSTPRFLALYEALGITPPKFVTLPPILGADKKKKLGKRDGAKDILEYRTEGYLPEAMVNFLALIGWNPGTEQELFDREALLQAFEISRIQIHGGAFNEEKLQWLNREYMLKLSDTDLYAYIEPVMQEALAERSVTIDRDIAMKLTPVIRERINVSHDVATMAEEGELDFYFADPMIDPAKLPAKNESLADVKTHLKYLREQITLFGDDIVVDSEKIKAALWDYATEHGRGNVLWPLRFALTGRERSPDPFIVTSIIGKETAVRRIDAALRNLDSV